MDLFQAERFAAVSDQSDETCRLCGAKLVLLRLIIDSETGTAFRMFECKKCGDRIWFE
jgi:DNA-directed RNA polymerase subunit RPC12/RpoP